MKDKIVSEGTFAENYLEPVVKLLVKGMSEEEFGEASKFYFNHSRVALASALVRKILEGREHVADFLNEFPPALLQRRKIG